MFYNIGPRAEKATSGSYFGTSDDRFSYTNVQCAGSEASLDHCPPQTFASCDRWEVAGVVCTNQIAETGEKLHKTNSILYEYHSIEFF
jgi:hypothetical protein